MTDLADIIFEEGVTAIPDVPYFVVGKNTTFSGFGPACDRRVYDVFPCETRTQANAVAARARRPLIAMTDVRIVEEAPAPGPDRVLVIRSPARVNDWADSGASDDEIVEREIPVVDADGTRTLRRVRLTRAEWRELLG